MLIAVIRNLFVTILELLWRCRVERRWSGGECWWARSNKITRGELEKRATGTFNVSESIKICLKSLLKRRKTWTKKSDQKLVVKTSQKGLETNFLIFFYKKRLQAWWRRIEYVLSLQDYRCLRAVLLGGGAHLQESCPGLAEFVKWKNRNSSLEWDSTKIASGHRANAEAWARPEMIGSF